MPSTSISIEQIPQTIRIKRKPRNVQLSRWFEKSKFSSVCPRILYSRLRRWALGSSLIDSNGRFVYRRLGKELEINFNGRNAQFHALYEKCYTYGYELETAALLLRLARDDKTFYDIGSNWGYFSLLVAAKPSFSGEIYAFEPNPSTFVDLKNTIAQAELEDRVTILNFGLGSEDENLILMEADKYNTGLARLTTSGGGQRVQVHKIDSLNLQPPDLIKLDAEFMEKDILLGGKKTLHRNRPHIIFESFLSFENPSQTYDTLKLLQEWGYQLFNPALLFQFDKMSVLASYGDSVDSLIKRDPNPQTALVDITLENRFLMREQLNIFACHESRLNELAEAGCIRLPIAS